MKRKVLTLVLSLILVSALGLNLSAVALAADTGTIGITAEGQEVAITVSPTTWDVGIVAPGDPAVESGLDHFTLTNTGNVNVDTTISGTDLTGGGGTDWTLSDTATSGADTYGLNAGLSGGSYDIVVKKAAPYNTVVAGLAPGGTQAFGLQFLVPTSITTTMVEKSGTITIAAVESP